MMRHLYASNCNCLSYRNKVDKFDLLPYNPWGFSKADIKTALRKSINGFAGNEYKKIYSFFIPRFFGGRSLFVEAELNQLFPTAVIEKQSRCLICNKKPEDCEILNRK